MANNIATIKPLEDLLKNRHYDSPNGKVEIGHFWSVLQCYFCMQNLQISINTLCGIAELVESRVDSKFRKTDKPINPLMLRKHLHLQATPRQISHTVVTKVVSKGISDGVKDSIKDVLLKNNSYGDDLHGQLCQVMEDGKGQFVDSKATTMGVSDFVAVLSVSLMLIDMYKKGFIESLESIPNTEHKSHIITKIKEYQKSGSAIESVGLNI